jgi:hypothetical protein
LLLLGLGLLKRRDPLHRGIGAGVLLLGFGIPLLLGAIGVGPQGLPVEQLYFFDPRRAALVYPLWALAWAGAFTLAWIARHLPGCSKPCRGDEAMTRADLRWPLAVAGVVFVLLQLRITQTPVAPYGWDGTEYIEHTTRLEYLAYRSSPDVMGPAEVIRELDSDFPPLLHIMTTPLAALGAHSAEAAARVTILWLFLLALAVAAVGERLGGRRVGLAAATGVLLLPSLQGYASRYYYDIPMTALLWGMVALEFHLGLPTLPLSYSIAAPDGPPVWG